MQWPGRRQSRRQSRRDLGKAGGSARDAFTPLECQNTPPPMTAIKVNWLSTT